MYIDLTGVSFVVLVMMLADSEVMDVDFEKDIKISKNSSKNFPV